MTLINQIATKVIFLFSILFCAFSLSAQTTQVGSGSCTYMILSPQKAQAQSPEDPGVGF